MKDNKRLRNSIFLSVLGISLLWCIKSAEILFSFDLGGLGVLPLHWQGLLGIVTAPLIHGSLEHLFNNTLPLLILGSVLLYGYPISRWRVIVFVWGVSGLGVWLFAREASHIGASGLAHGLFFYVFVASIFRRDKMSVGIMMVAFLMYGGMTMTIFPSEESISFEYHFFGALAGAVAALLWHKTDPKPIEKRYFWEGQDDYPEQELEDPVIGDEWRESDYEDPKP
jgi:membrane associated rhomboid family serine protease